jgi:hypothetical protein
MSTTDSAALTAARALLDELDQLRAAIGDSPAFPVTGFVRDDYEVMAKFDDGGLAVFAECYGTDAAALIVAAVNALPQLTAALREVLELADRWGREGERLGDDGCIHDRHGKAIHFAIADRFRAALASPAPAPPDVPCERHPDGWCMTPAHEHYFAPHGEEGQR